MWSLPVWRLVTCMQIRISLKRHKTMKAETSGLIPIKLVPYSKP